MTEPEDDKEDKVLRSIEKIVGGVGNVLGLIYLIFVATAICSLLGLFVFLALGQSDFARIVWISFTAVGVVVGVFWIKFLRRHPEYTAQKIQTSADLGHFHNDDQENGKSQ